MRFQNYLIEVQSESIKSVTFVSKDRMTKEISVSKKGNEYSIVVDTESSAPLSVRGVKSSLARSKYTDEDKALKAFDKKVAMAKKKGWKETKRYPREE